MNLHEVSFYYHYIVGGIFFLVGMILILASGELSPRTSEGRRYLAILIGGFVLYLGLHGLSVFVFPHI
jgi:hypothetical protein